jgi:AraC family transcriptional regulator
MQNDDSERAFGSNLARYLGQEDAPNVVIRTSGQQPLAVMRVSTRPGQICETHIVPPEDAFHLVLQRQELPSHELWIGGRLIRTAPYARNSVSIIDLRSPTRTRIASSHEALVFYLPRAALTEIAREYGGQPVDGLLLEPGTSRIDAVMSRLGEHLMPALRGGPAIDPLLIDQSMLTMQAYVAQAYGDLRPTAALRGGLAPWQERRAKELMSAAIGHQLTLAEIAGECGLSASHFARAFRFTTGVPPHRWLVRRRIEAAQAMLLAGDLPLTQIAQICGFSEHSSFTRTFLRVVGITPSAWRRANR